MLTLKTPQSDDFFKYMDACAADISGFPAGVYWETLRKLAGMYLKDRDIYDASLAYKEWIKSRELLNDTI